MTNLSNTTNLAKARKIIFTVITMNVIMFTMLLSLSPVKANAKAISPLFFPCAGPDCTHLYERVNIKLSKTKTLSYCKNKYGNDTFIKRTMFVIRWCAKRYNSNYMA